MSSYTSSSSSSSSSSSRPSTRQAPSARPIHNRRAASYQHHPKSRSVGSISSLPRALAMSSPAPSPAPAHSRPGMTSSKSMTIHPRPISSHRSAPPRASYKVTSPSPLPPTDTLSYFPPFESMGSSAEPDEKVGHHDHDLLSPPDECSTRPTHTKGRSLGSIAGFVNSFGIFTRKATSPEPDPDGAALQALSKKVTPGKRKVLETISVANQEIKMATRKVSDGKGTSAEDGEGRGKVTPGEKSHDEPPVASRKPSLHLPIPQPSWSVPIPSPPVTSISPHIPTELFSFFVDNPATSTVPAPSTMDASPSHPHPDLASPPAEMNARELANASRRSSSSSSRSVRSFSTIREADRDSISPVSSFSTLLDPSLDADSGASEPCTPEKSWVQGTIIPPTLAFSDSIKTFSHQLDATARAEALREADAELEAFINDGYLGARLRRGRPRANSTASARSADSNRTIRPGIYAKEEVTPKAGRGWKAMRDEEDGVEYFREDGEEFLSHWRSAAVEERKADRE